MRKKRTSWYQDSKWNRWFSERESSGGDSAQRLANKGKTKKRKEKKADFTILL